MQDYEQALLLHLMRTARGASGVATKSRGGREKSLNEQAQQYTRPGHGLMFCVHNRHKWLACATCKRTRSDGETNRLRYEAELKATQCAKA